MSGEIDLEDDRVNMIPLIDCMFFLILFFMLVTKFTPDEKAIASLLPTDKGQMSAASSAKMDTEQVNIAIYPAGLDKGHQPSAYRDFVAKQYEDGTFDSAANLRIGGSPAVIIEGDPLRTKKVSSPAMKQQIAAFHQYVADQLLSREVQGKPRKEQHAVIISCFSGLSWKYAMLAYDSVRAYEATQQAGKINVKNYDLMEAREVSFSPPRIRNYNSNELGNELYEIVHLR